MRNRIVIWGKNAAEEKVLVAANLDAVKNEVHVWVMPEKDINEEFVSSMMKDWREGKDIDLPESTKHTETELSIAKGFIPEGITVDRQDIVNRAQTEWHFIVLSSKLYQSYSAEVDEIKARIDKLEDFSSGTWEELKGFWKKVQDQIYDKTLFREHANSLRKKTNELFSSMKNLRQKREEVYQKESEVNRESFMEKLKGIEEKVAKGMSLQPLFEDLKQIQKKFNKSNFTRDHRRQVWNKLDKTFKDIKTKRFGSDSGKDWSPLERIERRYNGLIAAIGKMERSLQRDNSDLAYQKDKIARTDGQLEAQIREAKIKMVLERVKSKQEKLDDMLATKTQLEAGIEKEKERAAKKAEQAKIEEAKKAMEEKIANEIKDAAEVRDEESSKLEKAAEMIVTAKIPEGNTEEEKKEDETPSPETETAEPKTEVKDEKEETIAEKIEDSVEDAIDTVKSVATVVGSKASEKIEDMVDGVKDFFNKEEEKPPSVEDKTEEKVDDLIKKDDEIEKLVKESSLSEKIEDSEEESFTEKVEDKLEDAVDTVKSVATVVGSKAEEKFDNIVDGVKDFFNKEDKESDEKTEDSEGESFTEKVEDKLEDAVDTVKSVATVVGSKAEDTFDDLVEGVKGFFKKDEEE